MEQGLKRMTGPEILREIVVKITNDRKKLRGTGFFVSETEIVTCYHVLRDKTGQLSECYFVKHDDWGSWIEVVPLQEKCNLAQDIAFLKCPIPIKLEHRRIPFKPWDGSSKEFRSRGYDCNTTEDEGASTIEGEDCSIIDYTSRRMEKRLQLSTIKKTLLPGRSGSPVWSIAQNAIVGMIDYQAGDENEQKEKSMAILSEKLLPDLPPIKGEPINVPALPADFLPRQEDLDRLKQLVLSPGESRSAITGKAPNSCNGPAASIGLQGMGGIGKSVLAAALARNDDILADFPDGVIWITLGQQPNLPNRQLQLLQFLDKHHRPIKDVQDGLGSLRLILREKSCLIILDDVWAMDDVRAFDALGPNCRMLITTRDQKIVREMGSREFCLDTLSEEDSLRLLAIKSGQSLDCLDSKAKEVVEECDNLPLALAMVGSMAKAAQAGAESHSHELVKLEMVGSMAKAALKRGRPDPWEHILHRLRSADLEKISVDFPNYQYPNLMRAIEVSVDSLEPEERRHYLELAVFPEDTEVPEEALQLLWDLDQYDTADLADHFADLSLARLNAGRLSLHDLQHDFALKRAGDMAALHGRLVDAYGNICPDGWHSGPDDGYFFQHLAYHLLHSGKRSELKKMALDLRWLEARLEKTDLTSLISDFDLLPEDEEFKLSRSCLRLSSHVLFLDSTQIASQLLGRMQHLNLPGIKDLIIQAKASKDRPWLRPVTSSLTPPGGPLIRTLAGHADSVNAVVLTPDGRCAVSASSDNTLKVWDLESGLEIRTLAGHADSVRAVALTPDGRRAVSASDDSTIKVWDIKSGKEIRTLKGHDGGFNSVALTPDGLRAVSASSDSTLNVWDLGTGKAIQTLVGHGGPIRAIAPTADGLRAISASDDKTLKIWDLESGLEIRTLKGHANGVSAVALTPDGLRVVSASKDWTLKIWDLESGENMQTLKGGHMDYIKAVALTRDGLRAVSTSDDKTITVWDLKKCQKVRILRGHIDRVTAVSLTSDGQIAVSASSDGTLKVWNIEGDKDIRTPNGYASEVRAVALTSDGQIAVSASSDGTLKIWNPKSGQEIQTLKGHDGWVKAVILKSDGLQALLATCYNITRWDLNSDHKEPILEDCDNKINSVALTSDGRRAVSASDDSTLKVWDLDSGNLIRILNGLAIWVTAVAMTEDGRRAISALGDGTIQIWDLESGNLIRTINSHDFRIRDIALTPDCLQAVSASNDKTLKVWDLESGLEIGTLAGHADSVNAIALTPDGRRAVSASRDNTLKIWDLESGSLIASFTGESSILACAVAPDDMTIVAGEASGRVHFLRLEGYGQSQESKSHP
jgi:WD40 repeat protein